MDFFTLKNSEKSLSGFQYVILPLVLVSLSSGVFLRPNGQAGEVVINLWWAPVVSVIIGFIWAYIGTNISGGKQNFSIQSFIFNAILTFLLLAIFITTIIVMSVIVFYLMTALELLTPLSGAMISLTTCQGLSIPVIWGLSSAVTGFVLFCISNYKKTNQPVGFFRRLSGWIFVWILIGVVVGITYGPAINFGCGIVDR